MASTTFVDGTTTIYASWLNDVNTAVYDGIFPNGNLSLTNLTVSGSVTGAGFTSIVNSNLLAPGPIGSTTPNTGKFTTLQATGALTGTNGTFSGNVQSATISDGTTTSTVTNLYKNTAKAWVNFSGSTGTINASFNVSSVTRNSTGNYTVNFTTALANTNYVVATSCYFGDTNATASITTGSTYSTTQLQLNCNNYGSYVNNKFDPTSASMVVFI